MLMKAVEVLVTKKEFVLNSQLLTQVPPDVKPMIEQGYDSAVGLAYEVSLLYGGSEDMLKMPMSDWMNQHGPRVGAYVKELAKLGPPGKVDAIAAQIVVQESGDTGTITYPKEGRVETINMIRYEGRWLPAELVAQLKTYEGRLDEAMAGFVEQSRKANEVNQQQVQMQVGMATAMADGVLQPLLAANSQQAFDQALNQVLGPLMMMGAGMGGGPGASEFGPGAPGFQPPGAPPANPQPAGDEFKF